MILSGVGLKCPDMSSRGYAGKGYTICICTEQAECM